MQHQNVDKIWKVSKDETIMKQIHPDTLLLRSNGATANVSDVLYDQDEERALEIRAELNRFISDSNKYMEQDNDTLDENDPIYCVEGDAIEYE
jgi:hypothetical protein